MGVLVCEWILLVGWLNHIGKCPNTGKTNGYNGILMETIRRYVIISIFFF